MIWSGAGATNDLERRRRDQASRRSGRLGLEPIAQSITCVKDVLLGDDPGVGAVAPGDGIEQGGVIPAALLLLLGEQLEVVGRHDTHRMADEHQQARRSRRQVDAPVEAPVGGDNVLLPGDGVGQVPQAGQLVGRYPGGGPFGRLARQGGQDGEVVNRVQSGEAEHCDAAPRGHGHQPFVRQLDQGLADRRATRAELDRQLVQIEPRAGWKPATHDPVAQLARGPVTDRRPDRPEVNLGVSFEI